MGFERGLTNVVLDFITGQTNRQTRSELESGPPTKNNYDNLKELILRDRNPSVFYNYYYYKAITILCSKIKNMLN